MSSWSYDAASRVTANFLANGTRASNTYDNADQLLVLANLTSGGTTLSSFNYTYNPVGNRTQVVEADGDVVTWSYDPTYQLTNERRSGANAYNITYTYDPVGNRTLHGEQRGTQRPTPTTRPTSWRRARPARVTTTYTYDGNGNLLTTLAPGNQRTTNTWDGENRLTQVGAALGDRGYVHLQRRRPAGAEAGLDRHDQPRLGRREHPAGDQREQYHPGGVHAGAGDLWQPDLAVAGRSRTRSICSMHWARRGNWRTARAR